jgi:outer membrane protein TolC
LTLFPPTSVFSKSAGPILAFLLFLFCSISTPSLAKGEASGDGAATLAELIREIETGNQELLASEFSAKQFDSRIGLAIKLEDSLLAYYYLGFPARILREAEPPPLAKGESPANRAVTETIRGRALFERSTFMVKTMAENNADWYRAVSEDLHLQIIRRIREDFFQLYFQDRIIAVTEKTLATLDNLLGISRERYAVGQLSQSDVLQVQTEKTLLIANLLELRQKRLALATNLNYLAGRDPGAPIRPILEKDLAHDDLTEASRTAAELATHMRQNRPLSRGYRSLVETFGIMRLMIPMYYNMALRRDGLLEVESGMRATKAEMADFQNKVSAELVVEAGRLAKNRELAKLYGNILLPQTRALLAVGQADFEVGRADLLAPLQTLITLNRYQTEYYQALADHQISLARLEAASAMPLFDPALPNQPSSDGRPL